MGTINQDKQRYGEINLTWWHYPPPIERNVVYNTTSEIQKTTNYSTLPTYPPPLPAPRTHTHTHTPETIWQRMTNLEITINSDKKKILRGKIRSSRPNQNPIMTLHPHKVTQLFQDRQEYPLQSNPKYNTNMTATNPDKWQWSVIWNWWYQPQIDTQEYPESPSNVTLIIPTRRMRLTMKIDINPEEPIIITNPD